MQFRTKRFLSKQWLQFCSKCTPQFFAVEYTYLFLNRGNQVKDLDMSCCYCPGGILYDGQVHSCDRGECSLAARGGLGVRTRQSNDLLGAYHPAVGCTSETTAGAKAICYKTALLHICSSQYIVKKRHICGNGHIYSEMRRR